jgi:hypothetical protein
MHDVITWSKAALLTIVSFFTPIHQLLFLTTVLIAADFVTGVAASLRTGKRFTSSRVGATLVKVAVYSIGLCTSYIVETHFVKELPVVRMLASLVGLRELLSIFENLNIVSGQNLLTALINKVQSDSDKTPKS